MTFAFNATPTPILVGLLVGHDGLALLLARVDDISGSEDANDDDVAWGLRSARDGRKGGEGDQ